MCLKSVYKEKIKDGSYSSVSSPIQKLLKQYSLNEIKNMVLKKTIIIIPCGKCDVCSVNKRNSIVKRVKAEMSNSNYYRYLITFTFADNNIDCVLDNNITTELISSNISISDLSTLSKIRISNIIKNLKNKFNRYYATKVKFHYLLSGEYGESTDRAHYHLLLFTDKPIPNLTKVPVSGNHFTSDFFKSKQYNQFDITPVDGSVESAKYVCKYLNKSLDRTKTNYNRFEEKQIKYWINLSVYDFWIWNNLDLLLKCLLLWFVRDYVNLWDLIKYSKFKPYSKQREFIKYSRKIGISNNDLLNINNNVLNSYYFKKMTFDLVRMFNLLVWYFSSFDSIYFFLVPEHSLILIFLYLHLISLIRYKIFVYQQNIKIYFDTVGSGTTKYRNWKKYTII